MAIVYNFWANARMLIKSEFYGGVQGITSDKTQTLLFK